MLQEYLSSEDIITHKNIPSTNKCLEMLLKLFEIVFGKVVDAPNQGWAMLTKKCFWMLQKMYANAFWIPSKMLGYTFRQVGGCFQSYLWMPCKCMCKLLDALKRSLWTRLTKFDGSKDNVFFVPENVSSNFVRFLGKIFWWKKNIDFLSKRPTTKRDSLHSAPKVLC